MFFWPKFVVGSWNQHLANIPGHSSLQTPRLKKNSIFLFIHVVWQLLKRAPRCGYYLKIVDYSPFRNLIKKEDYRSCFFGQNLQ